MSEKVNQYERFELSKAERKIAMEVIKTGILRRHKEWQREIAAFINSPYPEGSNAFDRSMEITKRVRNFYKEAMRLEESYRNSQMVLAIVYLLRNGYLTKGDLFEFPQKLSELLLAQSDF